MCIIMYNKEIIPCFLMFPDRVVCVWVCQYLDVSLMWDVLQDDRLHGEDVGKLHLRDVERTHNVGPA